MTVLDQVLQAETANEQAVTAAKEAAQQAIAAAETAKSKTILHTKETIEQAAAAARTAAEADVAKEALSLISKAETDAVVLKKSITDTSEALTKGVVDAFTNA